MSSRTASTDGNLPRKGAERGKLSLKERGRYDFEVGRKRVQNLTRYHWIQIQDSWKDIKLKEEESGNEKEAKVLSCPQDSSETQNKSDLKPMPFTQTLNLELSCFMDEFPYTIEEPRRKDYQEEKQIYSNVDQMIEKKRQEAYAKLNKTREKKIEINHLMALYRLDMKRSHPNSKNTTSIFLTQEQLRHIHQKKVMAIQKLHQRTASLSFKVK